MKIKRNNLKTSAISFIVAFTIAFLLTSCGTTYHLSTLNYDPIYGPDGVEIKVDTIDSEFQLARKFRTDDTFRWNFAQFAMRQDMRWNYDFYFNNRMYRSGFGSPFAFYWNSNQYWWNWANNSHFNMGFNHRDIFGFYGNSYGWNNGYYGYGWNNGYYGNGWGYNSWNNGPWNNNGYNVVWNRSRENVSYNVGRRGSNNISDGTNSNIQNNIIVSRNKPRRIINNDDNIDNIVRVIRGNNNGKPIRVYNNPNNVPNDIRVRPNNNNVIINNNGRPPVPNNNSVRGSWRPSNNNSTINNNSSRGSTNISKGSSSSSSSSRGSSNVSRGGRGSNN